MNLQNIIFFAFFLLVEALGEITNIKINSSIFEPRVFEDKVPVKYVKKLVNETFVEDIYEVDFELSSYLYVHDGPLWGDDVYNTSKYGGFSSSCRIYKTDLIVRQNSELGYSAPPDATLVIQYNTTGKNGLFSTIYVAHENNRISVTDVFLGSEYANISMDKIDMSAVYYKIQQGPQNITVNVTDDDKINLISINGIPYIIVSNKMIMYVRGTNKQLQIAGFTNPGEEIILKTQVMGQNPQTKNTQFFTMTSKEIRIFEVIDEQNIHSLKTIKEELKDVNLLACIYDNGFFYATSLNKLFIIDYSNPEDIKIQLASVNGSCRYIEKFQTTLHLGCVYDKLYYIAEFFTVSSQLSLNRYYADEDIIGRAMVRRIGMGKMAIITDNDMRITNYGLNRNTLLENEQSQPEVLFHFKYGLELTPISVASSKFVTTMVLFCNDKLNVLKIIQNPPEIFCEYPVDRVGAQYQILMQFKTSRCSYVESEQDLLYGNIQSICQISVPILVESKQSQLEVKHTNFIQFILAVIIISLFLIIIAFAIKYNRGLETTFRQLQAALQKSKKGYDKKTASI